MVNSLRSSEALLISVKKWGTWELLAHLLKISVCIIGNWFLSSVKGKPGCIIGVSDF